MDHFHVQQSLRNPTIHFKIPVPSKKKQNNPADFLSRGMAPVEIVNFSWWHEPSFLLNPDLDNNNNKKRSEKISGTPTVKELHTSDFLIIKSI